MSIYSGFATRIQQQTYDQLLYDLIQLLSRKILKSYHHQQTDQNKFSKIIKQIFMKLSFMEKQKYLQPNLSNALYDIVDHYLKQDQDNAVQTQSKKNNLWVKIQDNYQIEQFTHDNSKRQSNQLSSRRTSSNFQIRHKIPQPNPQKTHHQKIKPKLSTIEVPVRNKFNKPTNNSISKQKQKQNKKKHQSMRRLEQDQCNLTQYHNNQSTLPQGLCLHCRKQTVPVKKKSSSQYVKQESDVMSRKQQKSSRIVVPELVKQYIQATNHNYMKHYGKRKLKYYPQLG